VQRHVVVIGAGIVGLAAAHELQHRATAVSTRDRCRVLALAHEGYKWGHIRPRDVLDYLGWPGLWKLCARHWLTGVDEVIRTLFHERFLARNARTGAGNP
jgi:glycine/D-amino acid oxidase-like deaminating enzyme